MAVNPLPPHSIDVERSVLGSILVDPPVRWLVGDILRPDDFYDPDHRDIYRAMLGLDTIDLLTVVDELERREIDVGADYVSRLVNWVPHSAHAEHHARTVADYADRRRLIDFAAQVAREAYDASNGRDPVAFAQSELLAVTRRSAGGLVHVRDAAGELYDAVERWSQDPLPYGGVRGLSTGIPLLDDLVEGLEAGDLVLIAARPSMGKSALAFEIARRVGSLVAVFSLEMTREKVLMRWASALSGVNNRKVKRGLCPEDQRGTLNANFYLSDPEFASYMKALSEVSALDLYLDDTPALTGSQIRVRALAAAQQHGGLDLVVVDHSGLMKTEGRSSNSSQEEGMKSQRMKELAKELGCPVILVQQLNRGVEGRSEKRPSLPDLRNSGEHEENADVVLGLYRDSYYNRQVVPGSDEDLSLEVIALKNRDGTSGANVVLRYERELSRFPEWEVSCL